MVVLDGNFALYRGPGTEFPSVHLFQYMLERTDIITNEVLESLTFVPAYHTIYVYIYIFIYLYPFTETLKIWQYQTS